MTRVAEDLLFPNGCMLTDDAVLLVDETFGNRVTAFDVAAHRGESRTRPAAAQVSSPLGRDLAPPAEPRPHLVRLSAVPAAQQDWSTRVDEDGRAALAAFCAREHRRVVGTLTLHCGDPHVAAELAQEALARVCGDWGRISAMAAPGAYLHRIAILASSHYRRRKAERAAVLRYGSRQVEETGSDPAGAVAVRKAVAALPLRQRTALVLRYYSDLSVQETADAMGCATGTVTSLTSQALASLRDGAGLTEPLLAEQELRHA